MDRKFAFLIATIGLLNFIAIIRGEKTALFCADYLACRSRITSMQHKCNDKARKITGESCSLNDNFWELQMLLKERETNFAVCIGRESLQMDKNEDNDLELPVVKCRSSGRTAPEETSSKAFGCRRAITNIKMRCDQIKLCCPAARHCERILAREQITNAVKQKHMQISRRTIECRTNLRNMLSSDNITEKSVRARAHAIVTAKLEDIVTEWPNDIIDDNVLRKFHNTTVIRTNSLYPFSSIDTNERKRKSRRKKIIEILSKRYDQFATFLDRLTAILLEQKMKRKSLAHSFKRKLMITNDSISDAHLEDSNARLNSIHKSSTRVDSINSLDGQHSETASRLPSNSFGNAVKNSYRAIHRHSDIHHNSETNDRNVEVEELSRLSDSEDNDYNFKNVLQFKQPTVASLHLSFIKQPSHLSDFSTTTRDGQEVAEKVPIADEKDSIGFNERKSLQSSRSQDASLIHAFFRPDPTTYKNQTVAKHQAHGISDTEDDGISDFRNAFVDQAAPVTREQNGGEEFDSSEGILHGSDEALATISEDKTDSLVPFQNPANFLNSQPHFFLNKSRIITTDKKHEAVKSSIGDAVVMTDTSLTSRSELETKPLDEKVSTKLTRIVIDPQVRKLKKLHRAEGVVTGLSPAGGAALRLNGYHNIHSTVSDTNRPFTNGEGSEVDKEQQEVQRLSDPKRRRYEMTSSKSRLHSQPTFEGNNGSRDKVKDPLKNGISKKKNQTSITVNLDRDIPQLATVAPGDAYVDDNGLWTMLPPNVIIKDGSGDDMSAEDRTSSQSGQLLDDHSSSAEQLSPLVHIRPSPIVASNKGRPIHPEVRGLHRIETSQRWHRYAPESSGKSLGIRKLSNTINGQIGTSNMDDLSFNDEFKNTMRKTQRTTTQESTMSSGGNMRREEKYEAISTEKRLRNNGQIDRLSFFGTKISKVNGDAESKLKANWSSDAAVGEKFAAIHEVSIPSTNDGRNNWPIFKFPNKKILTHLSEIRRSPPNGSSEKLSTADSISDVGESEEEAEDSKQHWMIAPNANHIASASNRQEVPQVLSNIDGEKHYGNKNLVWLSSWSKEVVKSDDMSNSFSREEILENSESEEDGTASDIR